MNNPPPGREAVKNLLLALSAERRDINRKKLPVDSEVWKALNKAAREARELFNLENETP